MKTEIVNQRILTADDGMVLTNGESFVKTVVLPLNADDSVWNEITEAEAQQIIARQEAEVNV
jgi:hypothetical protein